MRFSWHTGMASKRKSAVADEARGDEAELFQRQRVRTDSAGDEIPALPQEVQLPPRHDGRYSVEGGAIAVSCAAALIAWVTAVAQRQGYSRAAGVCPYHLPYGGCLSGVNAAMGRGGMLRSNPAWWVGNGSNISYMREKGKRGPFADTGGCLSSAGWAFQRKSTCETTARAADLA